jgi:hypothetical protein
MNQYRMRPPLETASSWAALSASYSSVESEPASRSDRKATMYLFRSPYAVRTWGGVLLYGESGPYHSRSVSSDSTISSQLKAWIYGSEA